VGPSGINLNSDTAVYLIADIQPTGYIISTRTITAIATNEGSFFLVTTNYMKFDSDKEQTGTKFEVED